MIDSRPGGGIRLVIMTTIEDIRGFEKRKDIGQLIKSLKYGSNRVIQAKAAVALGRLGNQNALKPLIKALNSTEGPQLMAAWGLGVIGDERAIKPLVEAFLKYDNRHSLLGPEIVLALNRIHSPRSFGLLVNILKDERKPDMARRIAAGLLGRLGDSRATLPLLGVLGRTYRKKRKDLLRCIIFALGDIKDDRAIGSLIEVLRTVNANLQDTIIFELMRFGELAKGQLKELMKDEDPAIRKAVRRNLKGM